MRFHKTPSISKAKKAELQEKMRQEKDPQKREELRLQDPRAVYKQIDEDGHVIATFDPLKDTTLNITLVEKEALTDAMHRVDDAEARQNCKDIQLDNFDKALREKEREDFIRKYREEYGCDPHPADLPSRHRTYIYYQATTENEDEGENEIGDSSKIELELSVNPFEDEPETATECMRRLVQGFTKREQEVYEIVFRRGKTNVYASRKLDISEQRVGQIVTNIKSKLKENEELRKHFRGL